MSLRTPSKIVGSITSVPYVVRFVTHGAAIKYSSIVKTLNRKRMIVPRGTTVVTYIGFTGYREIMEFPNINKGSMYELIKSLPPSVIDRMRKEGEEFADTKEGVILTLFVYELE
ncbi:hypothetical protein KAU33_03870 [Candidatus Dependentiae bacterium]|nr:hypothetical protein [Candidatus Dependentiae bacterium]